MQQVAEHADLMTDAASRCNISKELLHLVILQILKVMHKLELCSLDHHESQVCTATFASCDTSGRR